MSPQTSGSPAGLVARNGMSVISWKKQRAWHRRLHREPFGKHGNGTSRKGFCGAVPARKDYILISCPILVACEVCKHTFCHHRSSFRVKCSSILKIRACSSVRLNRQQKRTNFVIFVIAVVELGHVHHRRLVSPTALGHGGSSSCL